MFNFSFWKNFLDKSFLHFQIQFILCPFVSFFFPFFIFFFFSFQHLFSYCTFSKFCFSVVFGLFFIMNLVLWSKGSSAAVPFTTLVALLGLWFGVSVPLTFIGAYFGFRKRVRISTNRPIFKQNCFNSISGFGTSSEDQSDPEIDPRTIGLHPTSSRYNNGRCSTFRLHLHPTLLHLKLDLGVSNVLHVRLLVPGLHNSGHNVRGDHSLIMLFPFVRRRLSLVVEIVFDIRFHRSLLVFLLLPLFLLEIADRGRSIRFPIFRLYRDHGVPLQPVDGNHRFLRLL